MDGMPGHRAWLRCCCASLVAIAGVVATPTAAHAATTTATWLGGVGLWNDASMWDIGVVPNNNGDTTYDVVIDAQPGTASTVTVDDTETVNNVTVDAGDELDIVDSGSLSIAGDTIANSGTIALDSQAQVAEIVLTTPNVQLTGGGLFTIADPGLHDLARIRATPTNPGATFTNVDNSIRGYGDLGGGTAVFVNHGTIEAQNGTLLVDGPDDGTTLSTTLFNDGTVQVDSAALLKMTECSIYSQDAGTLSVSGFLHYDAQCGAVSDPPLNISGGVIGGVKTHIVDATLEVSGSGVVSPGLAGSPVSTVEAAAASFTSGTTLAVDIVGKKADSLITVSGDLALGDAGLQVTVAGQPTAGRVYVIAKAENAGSITGTFNGLPEGSLVHAGDIAFIVSYLATAADGSHEVTLTAEPSLSVGDVSVPEGDTGTANAVFTVRMWPPAATTVTVHATTTDGTATAGSDYVGLPDTIVKFKAGQTSKTVAVKVNGDMTAEGDETFALQLSAPSEGIIARSAGTGTILDDDGPQITVGDTAMYEGNSGTAPLVFAVRLSRPSTSTVTVQYQTNDVTATAGSDYIATSGTLTFAPGQTSKPVSVLVKGDTTSEGNESFNLLLANATNATIADGSGIGEIANDDGSTEGLTVGNTFVSEGDSGTGAAVFTVRLSRPAAHAFTVHYATANGTATAGSDYTAIPDSVLSFAVGDIAKTVSVSIIGDTVVEGNETFSLKLSSPSRSIPLVVGTGTATILNDDAGPGLAIGDVSVQEGGGGTTQAVFTIRLSQPSSVPVSMHYQTADGTATAGTDYDAIPDTVLTIAAGTVSQTVTVTVHGDLVDEADETFIVLLSSASGAQITRAFGTGTILNG